MHTTKFRNHTVQDVHCSVCKLVGDINREACRMCELTLPSRFIPRFPTSSLLSELIFNCSHDNQADWSGTPETSDYEFRDGEFIFNCPVCGELLGSIKYEMEKKE